MRNNYHISFDWNTMKFTGLEYGKDIKSWEILFPDIDILQEFNKMAIWLNTNKNNNKSKKKDWNAFITRWLKKAQQKAVGL